MLYSYYKTGTPVQMYSIAGILSNPASFYQSLWYFGMLDAEMGLVLVHRLQLLKRMSKCTKLNSIIAEYSEGSKVGKNGGQQ